MKKPEMKVITRNNVSDDTIYTKYAPIFHTAPLNGYDRCLRVRHFMNRVISNVYSLFSAPTSVLLPALYNPMEYSLYEAVYEFCNIAGTIEADQKANMAIDILTETICMQLMVKFDHSYIESIRSEIKNAILAAFI